MAETTVAPKKKGRLFGKVERKLLKDLKDLIDASDFGHGAL